MASERKLHASIVLGGSISSTLKAAFGTAEGGLKKIGTQITALTKRQDLLGKSIQTFGRMGKDVERMRNEYAGITRQVERLTAAQQRLNAAVKQHASINAAAGRIRGAGTAMLGAGVAGLTGAYMFGIRDAIKRQNVEMAIRNSGVSQGDANEMIAAARKYRQFGVSITEATSTVGELRTALGDAHHAIAALPIALKARSGLQLYDRLHGTDLSEGDSAYQLAKVAEERGGASSPEALRAKYNAAFRAITGSNGKVSVNDLLTSVRTGKGAVQSMSDEAFFGDTFLQQAMGANRYGTATSSLVSAWIGGHQTHGAFDHMMQLGLLDRNHVKFDKTGKVKTIDPNALVDAQTFLKDPQKWVDQHLVPLAQKQGVNVDDPAQVMAFVNSIASNQNAANLLLSRIRFRSNIWKDRHNVEIASDAEQSDRMNQQSAQGRFDNAKKRFDDAAAVFGKALLPAFATVMDKAAAFLETVTRLMEAHPRLTKAIAVGFTAIAGALVVLGPLLIGVGGALSAYAGYTLLVARFGGAWQMVGAIFSSLLAPIRLLGQAVLWLGRAILIAIVENPIGAAITLIAVAVAGLAYEIYQHWNGVTAFFSKLWADVKGIFTNEIAFIKALLTGDLTQAVESVKQVFAGLWTFVSDIFKGIGSGIKTVVDDIKSAVGMKSSAKPGAPAAIQWNTGAPPSPAMATTGSAAPVQHNDNRQITLNVQQQPGESSDAFARRVMRMLQQKNATQQGGALHDGAY